VLATERREVAMAADHHLAGLAEVPFEALADEPFIALPPEAGPLRDFWLAVEQRSRPPVIGVTASTAEEVFEAVASGLGVVLVAEGNAELYRRPGVTYRPVGGLPPAELAIAWRERDRRPQVTAFVDALRQVAQA